MAQARKFGAFSGVFTPSILTILGVIMYLRLPTIVGQAGLITTIGIVLLAHLISLTTGLSVSSIATDKKVKAGGTYYMISRSLGLPIGGTLGLALFVGLSFSVSLYVIGFSESFLGFWGWEVSQNNIRLLGSLVLLLVTTVTFISTSLALRSQFFILAAIILSLLSIFFGSHDLAPGALSSAPLEPLADAAPFIVLFGIFFPAVTGFEAGVSMSGDLKDPKRDIPRGAMAAIGVGLVVYIGLSAFLAYTVDAQQLANNGNILFEIALFSPLVVAGIWGATISSALGSILGAPRILQATAIDRITPKVFGVGYGKDNEPRNALLLTFVIAEAGILIGELDVIARIVSMFFITTYGFLNLSAAIENWASPDFRPDFRIPTLVPIIGALACFIVMIQLDFLAMIGATVVLGIVYVFLTRRHLTLEGGDAWEGFWSALIRSALFRITQSEHQIRNWRPNIILFSGAPAARPHLFRLGQQLVDRRGVLTSFELTDPSAKEVVLSAEAKEEWGTGVFFQRTACTDIYEGMASVATYYGFAGMEPNTVLLGWARSTQDPVRFSQTLQRFIEQDLNVLLLDYTPERGFGQHQRIDVWWRGAGNNIGLALALVRFLSTNDEWQKAQVRFLIINTEDAGYAEILQTNMYTILADYRVEASVKIINNGVMQRPVSDIMRQESAPADLTIVGIGPVRTGQEARFIDTINRVANAVGTVLLIKASSLFQEVLLGIQAHSPIEAPPLEVAKVLEEVTLVDRVLPEAPPLQPVVERVQNELQAISSTFVEEALPELYGFNHTLIDHLGQQTERVFATLRKSMARMDRPRKLRAIQRAQGQFLFQVQRVLNEYQEEYVPAQVEQMRVQVDALRSQLLRLIKGIPEEIEITYPASALQPEARDNRLLRLYKWSLRWQQRIRRQPVTYDVRVRDLAAEQVSHAYQEVLLAGLLSLARDGYLLVTAIQRHFAHCREQLHSLAHQVEQKDDITVADLQAVREEVADALSELEQSEAERLRAAQVDVWHRTRAVENEWAHALDVFHPNRHVQVRAREQAVTGSLAEIPARWAEHVEVLLNRALLDVRLQGLQNRLGTLVQRTQDELRLALTEQVRNPLRGVIESLETYRVAVVDDPTSQLKVSFEVNDVFKQSQWLDQLVAEMHGAASELPETVTTLSTEAFNAFERFLAEAPEVLTVAPRRVVTLQIDILFVGPLKQEVARVRPLFQRASRVVSDVVRLTLSGLGDLDAEADAEDLSLAQQAETIVQAGVARLEQQYELVLTLQEELETFIATRLQHVFDQLSPYAVTEASGKLEQRERTEKGRAVVSEVAAQQARLRAYVGRRLVRLIYRQSEGHVTAQRQEVAPASAVERLHTLREAVTPAPAVREALPFYYKQLFLGQPPLTRDLLVSVVYAMEQADKALQRRKQGYAGGLVILGEAFSGKSTLARAIARSYVGKGTPYVLQPPEGGSIDCTVFETALTEALKGEGSAAEIFGTLPPRSVLILDDLEQWWERSADGLTVVDQLLALMEAHGERCLFIVNANKHAFRFINQYRDLKSRFLAVIETTPFSAEELQQAILPRHRSTGVTLLVDGVEEDQLSEWKRARLFTDLFDYAKGNLGVALHAWVSHLAVEEPGRYRLHPFELPRLEGLDALDMAQCMLIIQFVLHRRLTAKRLLRITTWSAARLREELTTLERAGLVERYDEQFLRLNPFLQPFLVAYLVRAKLL